MQLQSFVPLWEWHNPTKAKKGAKKRSRKNKLPSQEEWAAEAVPDSMQFE